MCIFRHSEQRKCVETLFTRDLMPVCVCVFAFYLITREVDKLRLRARTHFRDILNIVIGFEIAQNKYHSERPVDEEFT